jgi:hypothetical protein
MVAITGNTYAVKDQLKALGAKWSPDEKAWMISEAKAEQARKLVAGAPAQAPATPGKCVKCGVACKAPYTMCWACKCASSGKCVKCGESLDRWERQHRVKCCSNCRDGGGNARDGQSYYDRHGNFVLGDDD